MWSCEADWNPEFLEDIDSLRRSVVRSVVKDDERVFSPVDSVLVQSTYEISEEEFHGLVVRVGLEQ